MTTYVALLRAINLAGKNRVAMADLRQMFCDLGFTDVETLLQSGNVVFSGRKKDSARLERSLEQAAEEDLDLDTTILVRTADEWTEIVAANPFPEAAERDPAHLAVVALKTAPSPAQVAALQEAIVGRESARAIGRQLYVVYPDGIGRSKFTNAVIERHLGVRGTARNWNTVRKIAARIA